MLFPKESAKLKTTLSKITLTVHKYKAIFPGEGELQIVVLNISLRDHRIMLFSRKQSKTGAIPRAITQSKYSVLFSQERGRLRITPITLTLHRVQCYFDRYGKTENT